MDRASFLISVAGALTEEFFGFVPARPFFPRNIFELLDDVPDGTAQPDAKRALIFALRLTCPDKPPQGRDAAALCHGLARLVNRLNGFVRQHVRRHADTIEAVAAALRDETTLEAARLDAVIAASRAIKSA